MSKTKKATKSKRASFKGCSTAIHNLYSKGLKPQKILVEIHKTWPACSLGAVVKVGRMTPKKKTEKVSPALLKAVTKPAKKAGKLPPPQKAAPVPATA